MIKLNEKYKTIVPEFEKARGYQIERDNYIADLIGTSPPPPDVGQETEIKPLGSKKIPYKRSPLVDDEDVQDVSRNRDRYNRQYGRLNNRYIDSRRTTDNGFCRRREDHDTNRRRRPDPESTYDYKYDY